MVNQPGAQGGVWISTEQIFTELQQVSEQLRGLRTDVQALDARVRAVERAGKDLALPSSMTRLVGAVGWAAAAFAGGWAAFKGG